MAEAAASLRRAARLVPPLVREALDEVRANARSHALTLAGIVWGSAAIVLLLSLGAGFRDFLNVSLERTGPRWVLLESQYTASDRGGRRPGREIVFEDLDLERLRAATPSARAVAGEVQRRVPVETPLRTRATVVSAGDAVLGPMKSHQLARGRYFDERDERARRRVAVLGANLPAQLFGDADPLGRRVRIRGEPFEVIGVLARKGRQLITMSDLHDNMAWVPLDVGRHALGTGREIDHLYLEPHRLQDEAAVRAEVRAVLWPLHRLAEDEAEAVAFMSVPEVAEPIRNIFAALTILLGVVGTVTLAMAAVGVANRMLAVASERRGELAMRRACGARRSDLVLQLLVETVVVVLSGGALGIAIALGLIGGLHAVPLPPDFPPPQLLPSVVFTTTAVLVGIGLAAGVLPARVAARVDPGTALRTT